MRQSLDSGRHRQPTNRPWLVVALLSMLMAISFLDRSILALVVQPLRASLHISDTQFGLLFGLGFVLIYSLMGIPMANWIDRGDRRRILLLGVTGWSVATLLSGFAKNYTMLVVCRSGIAIGESVLTPVAISMIADLFPRDRRTRPTSIYTMVGAIMSTGALVVGAGAVALAQRASISVGWEAWRWTLVIVAIPGLLLATVFAVLVQEPARTNDGHDQESKVSFAAALAHFNGNLSIYLTTFTGVGIFLAAAVGLGAWAPTLLIRQHQIPAARAGLLFGSASALGSIIGTMCVPTLIRLLGRGIPARGVVRAAIVLAVLTAPVLASTINSPHLPTVLVGIAIGMGGLSASAILSPVLVQLVTPKLMSARMVAAYLLISSILALGIGPVLVSILSEHVYDGPDSLGRAIGTTSRVTLAVALLCFTVALRAVARESEARRAQARRGGPHAARSGW